MRTTESATLRLIAGALLGLFAATGAFAQPGSVSYQGRLLLDGSPYSGTADFKFALISTEGGTSTLWSNDGSSQGGSQPQGSVPLEVQDGLFSVHLGTTPMVPLTSDLLDELDSVLLRVWVDTGTGFEQLSDQPLASAPFALHSDTAERGLHGFTAGGIIHSTSGGFQFPDGSIQTTAAAGGGGEGGTLDQAYDHGGPGAGRTVQVDAGAVSLIGPDGLIVHGRVGIGAATRHGMLSFAGIGSSDTTKILAIDESGQGSEFFIESGFAGTGATGNSIKLKTAWGNLGMLWRGDGKVGVGAASPVGRLSVQHYGDGLADPALWVKNDSPGGHAIFADGVGPEPTVVIGNHGGGPYLRGITSGQTNFEVRQTGKIYGRFLEVSGGGPFQVDANGKLRLAGAFGNGVGGVPFYSENSSSSGIAIWGRVSGSDATAVLEQNGTGSLVRGFRSGQLRFEVTNSGRVVTTALQITGGGDLAEPFVVADPDAGPGTVLVIDPAHAGGLSISRHAYDTRVAGVISGAGGIDPGITLHPGELPEGAQQVALTGRVYAKADAAGGPIRPGDLLTTSDRPGHLMRAEPARAAGAVVGKAMSSLESGTGMVLVLVSLQ